jgi:hypothetical protein
MQGLPVAAGAGLWSPTGNHVRGTPCRGHPSRGDPVRWPIAFKSSSVDESSEQEHTDITRRPKGFREPWVRCANCRAKIVHPRDAVQVEGEHRHRFINPAGYIFVIRCFSDWRGLIGCGAPSSEWTWFAGHTWQIQSCNRCAVVVGWLFQTPSGSRPFVGLDTAKLLDAARGA